MKKICPYQNVTYIGWDEVKVENCPIEEHYTGESSICCYDKDYKNCPTYNLQQENKQLKRDINIMQNYLQLIIDIGYDYDGYNDADNLKAVIDELCKYALYGKKLDDKSIISSSCEQYYNILGEALGDKE